MNPRLVKEADALIEAGFNVTVIYSYWNAWGTKLDKELLLSKKWKAIRAGGDPDQKFLTYFASRLLFKINQIVSKLSAGELSTNNGVARSTPFLTNETLKHKADLYIAHNLGALPSAVKASKLHRALLGFDAEDFHRAETTNDTQSIGYKIRERIEDEFIPLLNYLTVSSPLIGNAYSNIYRHLCPKVVLNVFPKSSEVPAIDKEGPLKLFWFSQTVGYGRGLEDVVNALSLNNTINCELHLLGDASVDIRSDFTSRMKNSTSSIHFHSPLPPNEIISFANKFDVGLALENNEPFNRDICLTNKIFTYVQGGLAVLASNTAAQVKFIRENGVRAKIYDNQNLKEIANALKDYDHNQSQLFEDKLYNYHLGQTIFNWNAEKLKFLAVINETLKID